MNVAFIPVRGGSKSIPHKNIKKMCGKPLVYWTVAAACNCRDIDAVYVATDSQQIRDTVQDMKNESAAFSKLEVIGRSAESASDTASTEYAMLEFAQKYDFDHIVLIQATSPLLMAEDLERGFALYRQEDTDSVLSVVRQKRFHWEVDGAGNARALNYDYFHRPRRQDFEGCCVENGAFYITSRQRLIGTGCRLSGRIKAVEMSEDTYFEIDESSDWLISEELLARRLRSSRRHGKIKMFLTDCDGCLTDGGMYYSEQGDELKKFCTLDGLGLRLLQESGVVCGIITGESTSLVARRAQKLRLDILKEGVTDKLSVVKQLCEEYHISLEEVAYVGDDLNDLEVIQSVGLSFSVPNAVEAVRKRADVITQRCGGSGAVRDAVDYVMRVNANIEKV